MTVQFDERRVFPAQSSVLHDSPVSGPTPVSLCAEGLGNFSTVVADACVTQGKWMYEVTLR